MLLAQLVRCSARSQRVSWPQCLDADMLHTVVGDVQGSRNGAVGDVLVRCMRGSLAPEAEQQHSGLDLSLLLLCIL